MKNQPKEIIFYRLNSRKCQIISYRKQINGCLGKGVGCIIKGYKDTFGIGESQHPDCGGFTDVYVLQNLSNLHPSMCSLYENYTLTVEHLFPKNFRITWSSSKQPTPNPTGFLAEITVNK